MRNGVKLQHRHYVKIAGIIADLPDPDLRERVAEHFANKLLGTNPHYSVHRFYTAAVGEPDNGRDRPR